MNLFIISDIHGMYQQFEELLTYWNPKDKLVLLGDLVDRGPHSLEVIQKAMKLKETYGDQIIICKGNHDEMFLEFIEAPEIVYNFYLPQGGRNTIQSFLNKAPATIQGLSPIKKGHYIKSSFEKELAFLKSGKLYDIIGDVLLTHAGFDSTQSDPSLTDESEFLWTRDHYLQPNLTPFINVFGHTPTTFIHKSNDIWISNDKKYIAVDGGCVFGGQLNAVLLTTQGEILQTFHAKEN